MRVRVKTILIAAPAAAAVALVAWAVLYGTTLAFLMDIAGYRGAARGWLPAGATSVDTSDIAVPTRHGPLIARILKPSGSPTHTVIVVPELARLGWRFTWTMPAWPATG